MSLRYTKYHILHTSRGFTLIELLVVISIIGVLIALSVFGLQGARKASRDAKRKSDIEQIRSGIEIYKSDCDKYPPSLGSSLVGDGSTTSCLVGNTYISSTPIDPLSPTNVYSYYNPTANTYEVCATLEQGGSAVSCNGSCGTAACNYKVTNP